MLLRSLFVSACSAMLLVFSASSAVAVPMPMLVLDSTASTATIVDANDPSKFAVGTFTGAPALHKGTFRQIYRTQTSIFYLVFVADGAGHLLTKLVEFSLTGAPPAPGPANGTTLPVSNSASNFTVTCNGKYIIVCGNGPTPVAVIDSTTGVEVDTLTLPNNVSNVFCPLDDVTVLAVEADVDNVGLGVRRLSISAEGELTDTGEFLNLPGAYSVIGVPGTGFGIALNRSPMTDSATAFTIAGMTSNGGVPLVGETADSLTFPCGGTRLFVRSNITGAPIEAASIIEAFDFDTNLGTITAPAAFSFTAGAAPTFSAPGESHVAPSSDAALIAVTETAEVKFYSSADGSFVREFAPANFSAGDLSFLSCCQFASVHPPIFERVTDGPDVNSDMSIDTEIPVRGATPSTYTVQIDLNVPSPIPSFVVEQVGPVWDVVTATSDDPADPVFVFPGFLGALFNLPTYIIWAPSGNIGNLTFEMRTRQNLFLAYYLPKVAGPVSQTVGALVFNIGGQPVVDQFGNPVIGSALSVTAVGTPPVDDAPSRRKRR